MKVPAELLKTQRLASQPRASAWVTANAGAGKTHVLTSRVARLLLDGNSPERLLCLTYTKAAAAEMKERLFRLLGQWSLASDSELAAALEEIAGESPERAQLARARRLFASALETPGGLKVQTIHAFCERVLARFPIEANISPAFSVIDEQTASQVLRAASERVIAKAADDKLLLAAFDLLAAQMDEPGFAGAIRLLLEERRGGLRSLIVHPLSPALETERLYRAAAETLGVRADETTAQLLAETIALSPGAEKDLRLAADKMSRGTSSDQERAAAIARFLVSPDRARFFAEYCQQFLTTKDEPRVRLVTKDVLQFAPRIEEILRAEQQRIMDYLDRREEVATWEFTQAMLRVAVEIQSEYERIKSAHALLDYDDLIEKAVRLTSQSAASAWVLYKLDGGIDHILVDEAQDTSPDQWSLLAALSEEFFSGYGSDRRTAQQRTVFAVGDEKQSIFSFQGADPKGFDESRRHFEHATRHVHAEFNTVALPYSWRSTAAVLEAVDRVFASEAAADGLSCGRLKHIALRDKAPGVVEIWPLVEPIEASEPDPWDAPLDQPKRNSPSRRLAARLARTIQSWLKDPTPLESTGRPIEPGNIMILVRRRNNFVDELIRELKERRIPVAGADRLQLSDHIAVKDLMALGAFVLLSEDDLTLAALLKSPLCGFDDEALFDLAYDREGKKLWAALETRAGERELWTQAHRFLSEARAIADKAPPFEFFAHVLSAMGGRRRMTARLGHEANDPIDEFLNLALTFERDHAPSLQAFLHWLAAGATEIKRDLDRGHGEVRVMTVHGAKGLEAEIVILPDTTGLPKTRSEAPLIAANGALLWQKSKTKPVVDAVAERKRQQMQEYRRLLYVAMTRARDRLYICGYVNSGKLDAESWYHLVTTALTPIAQPVDSDDGPVLRIAKGTCTVELRENKGAPPAPVALPLWAGTPAQAERPLRSEAPSRLFGAGGQAPSPLSQAGDARFLRGRLIHRLLQSLPEIAPAERRTAGARFLKLRPELDASQAEEILCASLAVLEEPAFASVFAPGSRAEVPIAGTLPGVPDLFVNGQIDRIAVTPEDVLIVDFKTDRSVPETAAAIPPAYAGQLATYRALVQPLFPGKAIRCALLWSEGPKLMEIDAARLDAAIRALGNGGPGAPP